MTTDKHTNRRPRPLRESELHLLRRFRRLDEAGRRAVLEALRNAR